MYEHVTLEPNCGCCLSVQEYVESTKGLVCRRETVFKFKMYQELDAFQNELFFQDITVVEKVYSRCKQYAMQKDP